MIGIAELLRRFWNGRERIQKAMQQNFFPPARCYVCQKAWRYGSDAPGAEWVQCEEGHILRKPDWDKTKGQPDLPNAGDHHGDI